MSSASEFSIPVKIIFGPGKLAEAGTQIAGLGRKAQAADTFTYMKGIVDLNQATADVADARRILREALS